MERVGDRYDKMEGYFSTGQSPQRTVTPTEEEDFFFNVFLNERPLFSYSTFAVM
jgi:hypothetical protein